MVDFHSLDTRESNIVNTVKKWLRVIKSAQENKSVFGIVLCVHHREFTFIYLWFKYVIRTIRWKYSAKKGGGS